MPRICAGMLLLTFASLTLASNEIRDYAWQAPISESDSKLQRIELPLEVMLATIGPNLGDLAVFNIDGKPLPHMLQPSVERFEERVLELPFHKFERFLAQRSKTVTRREQRQQENSTSETQTTETVAVQSIRNDYLIELEPDDKHRKFKSLELKWQHEPAQQMLDLRIEVGNEIDRMRSIRQHTSLANNESADPDWRRIRNIPSHNRYLRLIPLEGITRFELEQVKGHYLEKRDAPKLTHRLQPELISEDGREYYYFRYPSEHQVQSMRFIPADSHAIMTGDLYYSRRAKPEERLLAQPGYRQHNIAGDEVIPSRPFDMTRLYPHAIWFTTDSKQTSAPVVELTYAQYQVIFLADGNGPYRLAWGNHVNPAKVANLREFLAVDLTDPEYRGALVTLGAIEEAGGPERLEPRRVLPWKKWLLWVLLLLAALVTGRMALGLYREMNPRDS